MTDDTEAAIETAIAAERDRIRGILDLPEAAGRERQAAELALTGCCSLEGAATVLAATPWNHLAGRAGTARIGLVVNNQENVR